MIRMKDVDWFLGGVSAPQCPDWFQPVQKRNAADILSLWHQGSGSSPQSVCDKSKRHDGSRVLHPSESASGGWRVFFFFLVVVQSCMKP